MKFNITLFLLLLALLTSCKEDDTVTPPNMVNNVLEPSSNGQIHSERIGLETESSSVVEFAVDNGSGGVYFLGINKNTRILGSMSLVGNIEWSRTVDFFVRDLATYESISGTNLVAVGGRDFDGDGQFEEGRIVVFDSNGEKKDEESVLSDDYEIWLNAVHIPTGQATPAGQAGGIGVIDDTEYPLLIGFSINLASDEISIDVNNTATSKLFQAQPNKRLITITQSPDGATYIGYNEYLNIGTADQTSAGYGLLKVEDFDVTWDKPISTNKAGTDLFAMLHYEDEKLYFAGNEYVQKLEGNETITDWRVGKVHCLNALNSAIIWETTINESYRSDMIENLFIDNNHVYVAGVAAYWSEGATDPSTLLGYGMVTKLNKSTGSKISAHTFGENTHRQYILCQLHQEANVYFYGYTNYKHSTNDGGNYDRWIIEVVKTDL